MKNNDLNSMSADDWDELNFPRPKEQDFDRVVERAVSRRGFLSGVLAFGSGAAVMGTAFLKGTTAHAQQASRFAFTPIPTATDGTVHVPEGYSWQTVVRWGDPLFSEAEGDFDQENGGSVEMSDKVFGENTDGMEMFLIGDRHVIAVNSEYTNRPSNLPQAEEGVPRDADDVLKLQNLQGVTVMELSEGENGWEVVVDSPFNRRITHNTPMRISGPAAGHELIRTAADPTGTESLGTMNNCGAGKTPWGTYLTCEENFNGYFGANGDVAVEGLAAEGRERYGLGADGWGYDYHKWDSRFDAAANPNEPHRAGYVVEIDPADPDSIPVKRTALGRFKHENAAVAVAPDGRVVVYSGDDERGEFLYKWVSRDVYVPGGDTSTLLEEGQLYVAGFEDDQTGRWIPLTPEATGMTAAEIAIFSRIAASRVGATTMDRPEWVAVNPVSAEAYCCLTNNRNRGVETNAGGDWQAVGGPNPREANNYGQIVRWRPADDDHATDTFEWDLYVMAGNPTVHDDAYAGSDNINEGNLFNSPDGMVIDSTGLIWIQTDGNYDNEGDFAGMGNNQMLAGDPATGRIERFLTGPYGCEVTGLCWSADRRTMFVGIQHPGAPFPDGEGMLPRSSVIAIKRDDNALMG
ncbi:PhoX family protein [Aquicoccus porphyridii]|uniref:PhoX family phosphatase n=1 Tax=Aquicoccus porphyridii TaxID=1852029 RepID=A0A5A9YY07_9RHOB|nr:PhoX family phosphatase [Aquicoccus porphyridii]KAA0909734.1 PhoX family phosphatase [Aquicoccus porphyridii]RAI52002.1 transcriptional initiation protein Tat [Rhodobacteraceae bacterium AsT-22]